MDGTPGPQPVEVLLWKQSEVLLWKPVEVLLWKPVEVLLWKRVQVPLLSRHTSSYLTLQSQAVRLKLTCWDDTEEILVARQHCHGKLPPFYCLTMLLTDVISDSDPGSTMYCLKTVLGLEFLEFIPQTVLTMEVSS